MTRIRAVMITLLLALTILPLLSSTDSTTEHVAAAEPSPEYEQQSITTPVRLSIAQINWLAWLSRLHQDPCQEYGALEGGWGPVRQHWFNHLEEEGYARYRSACIYGWGTLQWQALDCLWNMEHKGAAHCADGYGWHPTNVPQAKPFSKMGCASTDKRCQVRWGLRYIHDRYGSPSEALRMWRYRDSIGEPWY